MTFEVPPGKLSLRLSIESRPDEVIDTDDRSIEVPDFTEPKPRLTTPRVYVARNAREFRTLRDDPTPRRPRPASSAAPSGCCCGWMRWRRVAPSASPTPPGC